MLSNDKMAKLYKDLILCKISALISVTVTGDPSPTALQQIFCEISNRSQCISILENSRLCIHKKQLHSVHDF